MQKVGKLCYYRYKEWKISFPILDGGRYRLLNCNFELQLAVIVIISVI